MGKMKAREVCVALSRDGFQMKISKIKIETYLIWGFPTIVVSPDWCINRLPPITKMLPL